MLQILQRAVSALPAGVKARLLTWLSTTASVAFETWEAVWAWAKNNPANAVIIGEGIYRLGQASDELVTALQSDPNGVAMIAGIDKLSRERRSLSSKTHGHAESVAMGLSSGDPDGETARALARQEMGRALVSAFGSLERAIAVRDAFATLNDSDFAWLRAVGIGRAMTYYG